MVTGDVWCNSFLVLSVWGGGVVCGVIVCGLLVSAVNICCGV